MPYTPGLSSELVKFSWEQISPTPPSDSETRPLSAACDELDALDLLASYAPGYPVGSNGNVSVRASDEGAMIVTATQLPTKRGLQAEDFVLIDRYTFDQADENVSRAYYSGSKLPSSESILHWHFYRKHTHVNAVVHVHENTELLYSPESRAAWERLGVIETTRYRRRGHGRPAALGRGGHRGPGSIRHPEGPPGRRGTRPTREPSSSGRVWEAAVTRVIEVHKGLKNLRSPS